MACGGCGEEESSQSISRSRSIGRSIKFQSNTHHDGLVVDRLAAPLLQPVVDLAAAGKHAVDWLVCVVVGGVIRMSGR